MCPITSLKLLLTPKYMLTHAKNYGSKFIMHLNISLPDNRL